MSSKREKEILREMYKLCETIKQCKKEIKRYRAELDYIQGKKPSYRTKGRSR